MELRRRFVPPFAVALIALSLSLAVPAQTSPRSSSSNSAKHIKKPTAPTDAAIDAGAVASGSYRNKSLALSCKIPEGWVLRTEEMNDQEEEEEGKDKAESALPPAGAASSAGAKVLLAAFSRPPAARAEEVNSSILIAVERAASYPGLKDAAQYFGPLTEVAKSQGLIVDEDPYEIAVGTKTLVRGDFHKDVGSRVMHQSTLVLLSHGYAVSITIIAGTEDEVEELIDGLTFNATGK
jgi:hypothetical protein